MCVLSCFLLLFLSRGIQSGRLKMCGVHGWMFVYSRGQKKGYTHFRLG